MLEVFRAASGQALPEHGAMTVDKILQVEEGRKKQADTPMMVGMRSVYQVLSDRKIPGKQAYLARIGSLTQILARRDVLGDFMEEVNAETGECTVAESLIRSAAIAMFYITPKRVGFDIDDVLEKARAIEGLPPLALIEAGEVIAESRERRRKASVTRPVTAAKLYAERR